MDILSNVPSATVAKALSFGDAQFYFRLHAFDLQIAGWTFGRSTKLSQFDYKKLYRWFKLLDTFDNESNHIPYIASYWYSRTEHVPDVRYIVDYLQEYSEYRLDKKWWWQAEAVYLADHKLQDEDLALRLALHLEKLHQIPIIFRELPAFIYEKRGELGAALKWIELVKKDTPNITEGELHFMDYYVKERLERHMDSGDSHPAPKVLPNAEQVYARDPDEQGKMYSWNEIRAMNVQGLRLGMTQDEATRILKSDKWKGEWHPFVDPTFEYPFEKNGHSLWLYRVKGKDNRMHIWLIVDTEDIQQPQDFNILTYLVTQRYGEPSARYINPDKGGYVYYHTTNNTVGPKLDVEISKQSITVSLSDETILQDAQSAAK